jgi:hypothetical protein
LMLGRLSRDDERGRRRIDYFPKFVRIAEFFWPYSMPVFDLAFASAVIVGSQRSSSPLLPDTIPTTRSEGPS